MSNALLASILLLWVVVLVMAGVIFALVRGRGLADGARRAEETP